MNTTNKTQATILIIDDMPVNLAVIVESLERHDYRIVVAQDGEEGLERAALTEPDLILLDIMMPGLDGIEVCRRLKRAAATRDIPVIFMTALTATETTLAAFEAGAADYVCKPLRIAEVRARIKVHLALRASQHQLARQNAELREYRAGLERQVAQRTQELRSTSGQLRAETGARRALDAALQAREAEMRTLIDNAPDAISRCDHAGRLVYANPMMLRTLGVAACQDVLGRRLDQLRPGDPAMLRYQQVLDAVVASAEAAEFDLVGAAPQRAGPIHDQVRVVPDLADDGSVRGAIAIGRDVARQRQLEEELRGRALLFRELVENSPDTIARYDHNCHRVYANARLLADLGSDPALVPGVTPNQVPDSPAYAHYHDSLRKVLADGAPRAFELRWQAHGVERCTHIRMSPEFDGAGKVVQVLAVGRDITEIDLYRSKIQRQAYTDALTGLPNRALLFERIEQAVAMAAANGGSVCLMMLDLDYFKEINDTLGHAVGDQVLVEAARRLSARVGSGALVARLGGDEFAILLPASMGDPATWAARLLRAISQPMLIDGRELCVTGSIGIALCPVDSEHVEALFKFADSAMYHAKKQGRNHFQFYASEMTARASERMELEAALRRARKQDELVLHFQPQVELQSGRVVGAEALLRWQHPVLGMIAPDRFVAIAEECGLIVGIGEWVLAKACAAAVEWNRGRQQALTVAVNLSARQFVRNDLVGAVRRILAETGCRPAWLELEITESLLLEDGAGIAAMLAELRALGIGIAIDDFCTGYSALSYLNRFAVSQIKIDRSFVRDIPAQSDKCALVRAMLSVAQALRLDVVAEGIENQAQSDFLIAHGCQRAQGYLFGKPMPAAAFAAAISRPGATEVRRAASASATA